MFGVIYYTDSAEIVPFIECSYAVQGLSSCGLIQLLTKLRKTGKEKKLS